MDPPSEGVDGGSDPPSAFGLRAQQGTGDHPRSGRSCITRAHGLKHSAALSQNNKDRSKAKSFCYSFSWKASLDAVAVSRKASLDAVAHLGASLDAVAHLGASLDAVAHLGASLDAVAAFPTEDNPLTQRLT